MPKPISESIIKRQYLYVSDLQYLTSNVDLSQHYEDLNKEIRIQLKFEASKKPDKMTSEAQLCQNIRLALEGMIAGKGEQQVIQSGTRENSVLKKATKSAERSKRSSRKNKHSKKGHLSLQHSSAASTSSDSGHSSTISGLAQAFGSSASSTGSTSSLQDPQPDQQSLCDECNENSLGITESLVSNTSYRQARKTNEVKQSSECSLFEQYNSRECKDKYLSEQMDFGQCALDWFVGGHENYHQNKLVALISAGVTTGSDKKYVTDTVATLESLGFECCVFIRRGVGGLRLNSAKFFSCSKWRDFDAAVQSVRQQRPGARLVAIGFSFGSIELCRYLAMSGQGSLVDSALLVSCPFDPLSGVINMKDGSYLNRRIDSYLAKHLGKQLYSALKAGQQQDTKASKTDVEKGLEPESKSNGKKEKRQKRENLIWTNENGSTINLASLPKVKSIFDFENEYNRRLQHYPSAEAYAQDCEIDLGAIVTPTLCLSSEDDFMAPLKFLPLDEIRANKNLCMILMRRGGHMAFIDGPLWPKKPYFAQRIIRSYVGALKQSLLSISANSDPQ